MTQEADYRKAAAKGVESWNGHTDEQATDAEGKYDSWLEVTRLRLGRSLIAYNDLAHHFAVDVHKARPIPGPSLTELRISEGKVFNRRLFIDYCAAVHDAYIEFSARKEWLEEGESRKASDWNKAEYGDPLLSRSKLEEISDVCCDLLRKTKSLDERQIALMDWNYGVFPPRNGGWRRGGLSDLEDLLKALAPDALDASELAAKLVKPANVKGPLTGLILRLSNVLKANDMEANKRERGPLFALCCVALMVPEFKAIFGDPRDLRGKIGDALRREREALHPFLQTMLPD